MLRYLPVCMLADLSRPRQVPSLTLLAVLLQERTYTSTNTAFLQLALTQTQTYTASFGFLQQVSGFHDTNVALLLPNMIFRRKLHAVYRQQHQPACTASLSSAVCKVQTERQQAPTLVHHMDQLRPLPCLQA